MELFFAHFLSTLLEPDLGEILDVIVTFLIRLISPERCHSHLLAARIICALHPDRFADFADVIMFAFWHYAEHIPVAQDLLNTLIMIVRSYTVTADDVCVLSLIISVILLRAGVWIDWSVIGSLGDSDSDAFLASAVFSAAIISGRRPVNLRVWLSAIQRPVQTRFLSVFVRAAARCVAHDFPEVLTIPYERLQSDWIYESPHVIQLALALQAEVAL
jgi:hypothetical protein